MLKRLFNPSSIAIIGASNNTHKSGGNFPEAIIRYKYKGNLYPVNPKEKEILGLKAYAKIGDIPGDIDLAIITIPAFATPAALKECVEKKVKFVIVHTAGFAETGEDGKQLEQELVDIIKGSQTRVVGPNCLGMYCPDAKITTIMPSYTSREGAEAAGTVAFISQSGWATESAIMEGFERGLRYSKIISIGNQCDLALADYLEYLGNDPKTKVIMAYTEGIKDARRFFSVAKRVTAKKPVIIWKSGKTAAGARAAVSHTGSLAGRAPVLNSALKQVGIIQADNIFEMLDFAVAFQTPYLPKGKQVGVLVEAGGGAVAASDGCEKDGLSVNLFSETLQDAITDYLLSIGSPKPSSKNPVDLVWPPNDKKEELVFRCMELMAAESDIILWVTYTPLDNNSLAQKLEDLQNKIQKTIVPVPALRLRTIMGMDNYTLRGMPVFTRIERASKAISVLAEYAKRSEP